MIKTQCIIWLLVYTKGQCCNICITLEKTNGFRNFPIFFSKWIFYVCIKNRFKNKRLFSFYKRRSFFPPWFRFCRPTPRGPSCAVTDAGDLSPCLPIQASQRLKECLKSISFFFFTVKKKCIWRLTGYRRRFDEREEVQPFFFFTFSKCDLVYFFHRIFARNFIYTFSKKYQKYLYFRVVH